MATPAKAARGTRRAGSRRQAPAASPPSAHRRGPADEVPPGGADGVVLPMTMIGDGVVDSAYTVTATVGPNGAQYAVLVDTGSSDLWLASTSCSSHPCSSARSRLYDAHTSRATNHSVQVKYLVGEVDGPVVWDRFSLGGFAINSQALIAASHVADEHLASGFSGILGLALESNSQISEVLPSVTNDDPDGAPYWSNVFGAEPHIHRFFSFSLERPGFTNIPSLLGIGAHPPAVVPDPTAVKYWNIVPGEFASTFWRVQIRGLTAYVNNIALPIDLGRSVAVPQSPYTVAVFDTGGPVILASTAAANAIYGAWNIMPPQNGDGHYFMPCSLMMNLSVTIGNTEFPLHPLDLNYNSDPSSKMCTGTIVASPSLGVEGSQGDIIFGVPFLRNVYSVLSYSTSTGEDEDDILANPRFGMMSLTDPASAIADWNRVRVQGVPLRQPDASTGSTSGSTGGKKLSVGVEVLLGIIGFFILCGVLFLVRWFMLRRRFAAQEEPSPEMKAHEKDLALALSGGRYGATRNTQVYDSSDMMALHNLRYDEHNDKQGSPTGAAGSDYAPTSRTTSSRQRDSDRYTFVSSDAVPWPSSADGSRPQQWRGSDAWSPQDMAHVDLQAGELGPYPPASRTTSNDSDRWRRSRVESDRRTGDSEDPLLPPSPAWPRESAAPEQAEASQQQFVGVGTYAAGQRRLSAVRSNSTSAAPAVMSPLHVHRPLVAHTDESSSAQGTNRDSAGDDGHARS
ncbi:acid protease [Auricularia subglabra TFB-10046 SS5]|nr:acid protease [Auricularia subglabra TFB-10046 SS5]